MKIARSKFRALVREALVEQLKSLSEEGPEIEDGEKSNKDKDKKKDAEKSKGKDPEPKKGKDKPPSDKKPPAPKKPAEPDMPDGPQPEELSPDPNDAELDEPPADDGSGTLSDSLSGKSIQTITQEPKSQLVPGAQEIVVTFNDTPDPLRIVVTNSGLVKFWWRNSLHNKV